GRRGPAVRGGRGPELLRSVAERRAPPRRPPAASGRPSPRAAARRLPRRRTSRVPARGGASPRPPHEPGPRGEGRGDRGRVRTVRLWRGLTRGAEVVPRLRLPALAAGVAALRATAQSRPVRPQGLPPQGRRARALMVKTSYVVTASDPGYANVNGDDLLPDLALGRLPAGSLAEATTMIAKTLAFESAGQSLDGPALMVADNADIAGNFED